MIERCCCYVSTSWDHPEDCPIHGPLANISPPQWFIDRAIAESIKSPCQSKRGVVIWNDVPDMQYGGYLISAGFNQRVRCDGSDFCKSDCAKWAKHAEQDAILQAEHYRRMCPEGGWELLHVKTVEGTLVPSGPPSCKLCSHLILVSGLVAGVWLYHADGWRRYLVTEFHHLSLGA